MLNRRDFLATLPRRRLAAGAIIRDHAGRVCLVEPTYKDYWILPGGTVEADESPRSGCHREVLEELGLDRELGSLLCMEWLAPDGDEDPHGALMFCYDGGVFDEATIARIVPQEEELRSFRFVPVEELSAYTTARNVRRIEAALSAIGGLAVELEPE